MKQHLVLPSLARGTQIKKLVGISSAVYTFGLLLDYLLGTGVTLSITGGNGNNFAAHFTRQSFNTMPTHSIRRIIECAYTL